MWTAEVKPSDLTLLLTRPRPASERFAREAEEALGRFGAVVVSPVLEIVPHAPVPELAPGAVLVFTSENAVLQAAPALKGWPHPVWCVGDRTANAARGLGLTAFSAEGDAAALAALLLADPPDGEIVHLSGVRQAGDLAGRLTEGGLNARRVPIYDQRAAPLNAAAHAALSAKTPLIVPLFSPRSATLLHAALPPATRAPLWLAFLSPAVAAAWPGHAERHCTARAPDSREMIAAIARLLKDARE